VREIAGARFEPLRHVQQLLHLKDQRFIRANVEAGAALAVGEVGGNGKKRNTFAPSFQR